MLLSAAACFIIYMCIIIHAPNHAGCQSRMRVRPSMLPTHRCLCPHPASVPEELDRRPHAQVLIHLPADALPQAFLQLLVSRFVEWRAFVSKFTVEGALHEDDAVAAGELVGKHKRGLLPALSHVRHLRSQSSFDQQAVQFGSCGVRQRSRWGFVFWLLARVCHAALLFAFRGRWVD